MVLVATSSSASARVEVVPPRHRRRRPRGDDPPAGLARHRSPQGPWRPLASVEMHEQLGCIQVMELRLCPTPPPLTKQQQKK